MFTNFLVFPARGGYNEREAPQGAAKKGKRSMVCANEVVAAKLRRWEKYLTAFTLPAWEERPAFDLYIDQVVSLAAQYLNFLPADEHGNPAITASAVNNYVRLKLMPPPRKKRYSRLHLAYLMLICILKQSMSMTYVKRMLPPDLSLGEMHALYDQCAREHKATCLYFAQQVRQNAQDVMNGAPGETAAVERLIFCSAIIAGFSQLLTEKILRLEDAPPSTEE